MRKPRAATRKWIQRVHRYLKGVPIPRDLVNHPKFRRTRALDR